jgi:hypothetical protein
MAARPRRTARGRFPPEPPAPHRAKEGVPMLEMTLGLLLLITAIYFISKK